MNLEEKMKIVVNKLIDINKTVSTMESCTGGGIVNEITNIEGASAIIKFSAITYSNEYKIKMGVNKDVIDKYSVYSLETAMEMSSKIANFTNSNYGIGVTGKLNRVDVNNLYGDDGTVFISIYDKDNCEFYNKECKVDKTNRIENKELIVEEVVNLFLDIL